MSKTAIALLSKLDLAVNNLPEKSKAIPDDNERIIPPYDSFNELGERYFRQQQADNHSTGYIKDSARILFDFTNCLLLNANAQDWRDYTVCLSNRGVSNTTIAHCQTVVREFYKFLRVEGMIDSNPFEDRPSPKRDKRLPQFFTQLEAKTLVEYPAIDTAIGIRDRTILEFFYATGIRTSELINLELNDISIEEKQAIVKGKGNKERYVLFGEPAREMLILYLKESRPSLLNGATTKAVFLNSRGRPLTPSAIGDIVEQYTSKALGKKGYPHLLRHTFATHLLDGGADLRVIQELLGHTNVQTTQIYTSVSNTHLREIYHSTHPMGNNNRGVEQ